MCPSTMPSISHVLTHLEFMETFEVGIFILQMQVGEVKWTGHKATK